MKLLKPYIFYLLFFLIVYLFHHPILLPVPYEEPSHLLQDTNIKKEVQVLTFSRGGIIYVLSILRVTVMEMKPKSPQSQFIQDLFRYVTVYEN